MVEQFFEHVLEGLIPAAGWGLFFLTARAGHLLYKQARGRWVKCSMVLIPIFMVECFRFASEYGRISARELGVILVLIVATLSEHDPQGTTT